MNHIQPSRPALVSVWICNSYWRRLEPQTWMYWARVFGLLRWNHTWEQRRRRTLHRWVRAWCRFPNNMSCHSKLNQDSIFVMVHFPYSIFLSFNVNLFLFCVCLYSNACAQTATNIRALVFGFFVFMSVCVCLHYRDQRGPEERAGTWPVHPLSRWLQKLLHPWRVSVPQYPGAALLQVD